MAEIAAQQHGVITTRQLLSSGVANDGITVRLRAGRLHRIYRGVYAVGHPGLGTEGRWMAAVLASGAGAALSHRSAAALWGLLPSLPRFIEVTVPHKFARAGRDGVRLHRSRSFGPSVLTLRRRIPVTTPARTIADLRRVASPAQVRRAIREAEVLGFETGIEDGNLQRSELERLFLRLCRRHRLPTPEVNVPVGRFTVDFHWRDRSLIVETDGYRFHRGRQAFEDDRARDTELRLMGYAVVRFTYRQVTEDPRGVATSVRRLLSRPESGSGSSVLAGEI